MPAGFACEAGLGAACAITIVGRRRVIAALVLFLTQSSDLDQQRLKVLAQMSAPLSAFLKQAQ